MAPVRSAVVIPFVDKAFTDDGEPTDAATTLGLRIALEDLAWWAGALKAARDQGELVPGKARARMAATVRS